MKSSSLRRSLVIVLPALTAVSVTGCFNSPNKSNISCTKSVYCPDGLVCVGASDSKPGVCAKATEECNDGNPCTDDTCDAKGNCQNAANNANSCTDPTGGCLAATHCVGGVCSGTLVTDGTHRGAHSCVGLNWNTQTCVSGRCTGSAVETNCDDSNLCTNDTCNDTSGCAHSTITCTAPDKCHTSSCSPSAGCTYTEKTCAPDACHTSATCNLSTGNCEQVSAKTCSPDACHTSATCNVSTGNCDQGTAKTCSPDACHTTATCTLPNGCQQGTPAADGTLCLNGAYCSGNVRKLASCVGGTCTEASKGDCTTLNTACKSYTCQASGSSSTSCVATNAAMGTPCPPDQCHQTAVCASNGTCAGQTNVPDGTPCPSAFSGGYWYGTCLGVNSLDWYPLSTSHLLSSLDRCDIFSSSASTVSPAWRRLGSERRQAKGRSFAGPPFLRFWWMVKTTECSPLRPGRGRRLR